MAVYKTFAKIKMTSEGPANIFNRWLSTQYGSRLGFVVTHWHRLLYFLGCYRQYRDVDWQSVKRLVFICKGNICRSAYAEVFARSLGVEAISCGLETIEYAPANDDARRTALQRGYTLEDHRTKPVMYMVFKPTDLLIVMEPWQVEFLSKNLQRKHQYTLLGLWAEPVLPHLQDPYGCRGEYFNKCFSYIEKSAQVLASNIRL